MEFSFHCKCYIQMLGGVEAAHQWQCNARWPGFVASYFFNHDSAYIYCSFSFSQLFITKYHNNDDEMTRLYSVKSKIFPN